LGRRAPTRWEALALLPSEDGAGVELHVRWRTT
jgi:hypothetical protein